MKQAGFKAQSTEENMEDIKWKIAQQLAILEAANREDAAIDRTCVELSTLHGLFSRKHVMMRRMRGRMDLGRFDKREAADALD